MNVMTRELLSICEQLPEAKRVEVTDFARFLLARSEGKASDEAADRWLVSARGVATPGVTTDQVMALTRGEP